MFLVVFLYFSSIVFSFEPELKWKKQGEFANTNAFVFSKDGKFIYVQYHLIIEGKESFIIQKWNIEEKKVDRVINCSLEFKKMALSNDEHFIVGANNSNPYFQLLDFTSEDSTKISTIKFASDYIMNSSLSFSEDGKSVFVYNSYGEYLMIVDVNTLENLDGKSFNFMTTHVEFSPDGKYACISVGDSSISVLDMTSDTEIYRIKIPYSSYNICHLSINSEYFVVNYLSNINPENIEVYSMKTGKVIAKTKSGFIKPYSIILNDNKTILTSTIPKGYLEKYDFISNTITKTNLNLNGDQLMSSPQGNLIAGKDSLNYLFIDELTSEKPILFLNKINANFNQSSKIVISPDNKYIYASGIKVSDTLKRGQIIEFEFGTGIITNVYPVSEYYLTYMSLSKDGKILYAVDSSGRIEIISNLHSSDVKRKSYNLKKSINTLAVSEDNTKLIAGGYMSGFFYINLKTDNI
jgi:WD40 repeat protein